MKCIKVQIDLVKAADGRDGIKKKNFSIHYFITENKVWVCPYGVWMMGIPKDLFYLDKEKIWKDTKPFVHGETFFKNLCDLEPAIDTHIIIDTERYNKKMKLHKFKVNDEAVFVPEKILNYFEPDATFRGSNRNSPIYVYELDEVVGMIRPVNYKEGEEW